MKLLPGIWIIAGLLYVTEGSGQRLGQKDVPSVILNNFRKNYPKAFDVTWEKVRQLYKVEFSTAESEDQEIWYNESLEMVRHVEEIVIRQVPKKIKDVIDTQYKKFKPDELKKITIGKSIRFLIELESGDEELKVTFSEDGEILSQVKTD